VICWPAVGLPVVADVPPAPWPSWLLARLQPRLSAPSDHRVTVPDSSTLAGLVRTVAWVGEGERNCVTFWAACRAGEMVRSGLLDIDTAVAVIAEAATRAGLPRTEAERTALSGAKTGAGGYDVR